MRKEVVEYLNTLKSNNLIDNESYNNYISELNELEEKDEIEDKINEIKSQYHDYDLYVQLRNEMYICCCYC